MSFSTHKVLLSLSISWFFFYPGQVLGQQGKVIIRGTVYNMYRTRPLDGVSVVSTTGKGTATDSTGVYILEASLDDSIYFSYLGRATPKFAVRSINTATDFDVALHVDPLELKEVRVMPHNYRMDSLKNRQDYAKIFDFKKPGFKITSPNSGLGAGVDLDELINVFRFQRTKRIVAFQRRLEEEEQDKFVDHRFSHYIVKKITRLDDAELDTFMVKYRPSYDFCKRTNDYDFFDYIKLAYRQYKKDRKDTP
ncbi:peptidase associated/transthyretin-like domain-containing protein [Flavitalea flava]